MIDWTEWSIMPSSGRMSAVREGNDELQTCLLTSNLQVFSDI